MKRLRGARKTCSAAALRIGYCACSARGDFFALLIVARGVLRVRLYVRLRIGLYVGLRVGLHVRLRVSGWCMSGCEWQTAPAVGLDNGAAAGCNTSPLTLCVRHAVQRGHRRT